MYGVTNVWRKKEVGKEKNSFSAFFFVGSSLKNRIVLYSWLKKFTGISFSNRVECDIFKGKISIRIHFMIET